MQRQTMNTTCRKLTGQRRYNQTRLLKLKRDYLKISTDLETVFAAETHLAEGQWLEEQLNKKNSVVLVSKRTIPIEREQLNNNNNNNNNSSSSSSSNL
jgi:hypothetical protein